MFQPPGFGQYAIATSLGSMVYYTATTEPWVVDQLASPLIFLHNFGGGASAYEWSRVYSAFATTHRIIAPDLIGWGQSTHPVREYQISDYLTTITEFLQQFSPPVSVVASSLTAALVLRLATQKPELFQRLFLVCPSGFADFGEDAGRRLPASIINTALLDRFIYILGATNELAVRNFLCNFLFANPNRVDEEIVAAYLDSAQQPNAEYAALAFLRGDLYFDLSRYIPLLSVPTVIYWGEKAQFTSIELGKRLARLNPQAIQSFIAIPETGVLPHLEQPEIMTGLLQRSLKTDILQPSQ